MKKLDTSAIAPGIAFKPKGGTLMFLQLAYQEALAELTYNKIGSSYDPTKGYILNGCVNTGSGSNYVISAGSIFFNGEIFIVPAATFTISGGNVAEGAITTTQYITDADPSVFTDGVSRNVHNIRQIVFAPALSGSGSVDFNNAVQLAYKPVGSIGQTVIWQPPSGNITDYFNVTTHHGTHPLTLGWDIDTTMGGKVAAGYLFTDANFGTLNNDVGALNHTISANDLPSFTATLNMSDNGTLNGSMQKAAWSDNESVAEGTIDIAVNPGSPNNPVSLLQPTVTKLYIVRVS